MKHVLRKFIQRLGYDLYRYPESCERLIPHLELLLPIHCIDTVIDVGANVGQFASEIRALSRDVRIHSIEPNPDVYKVLMAKAAGDNRWTTHECALGRSSGKVMLNVFASSDFSSCLPANDFGTRRFYGSLTVLDTVEVELRTLDDLVSTLSPASLGSKLLLKLDTQGFDMEVLMGAEAVLERVKVIVTEASLRPLYQGAALFPEILEFMKAKGFVPSGFFPVSRHDDVSIIEFDCVFVRVTDC